MGESKHTRGPWAWSSGSFSSLDGPDGQMLLTYNANDDGIWPSNEADRPLIASAPDLLEALRGMADAYVALLLMKAEDPSRFKEPGSPYAKAISAIAKAEGRDE